MRRSPRITFMIKKWKKQFWKLKKIWYAFLRTSFVNQINIVRSPNGGRGSWKFLGNWEHWQSKTKTKACRVIFKGDISEIALYSQYKLLAWVWHLSPTPGVPWQFQTSQCTAEITSDMYQRPRPRLCVLELQIAESDSRSAKARSLSNVAHRNPPITRRTHALITPNESRSTGLWVSLGASSGRWVTIRKRSRTRRTWARRRRCLRTRGSSARATATVIWTLGCREPQWRLTVPRFPIFLDTGMLGVCDFRFGLTWYKHVQFKMSLFYAFLFVLTVFLFIIP